MRTNSDPERDDALVNAVLRDEGWQAVSATLKAEALGAFHARQRVRRLTRWAGSVATLAALVAAGVHWLGQPAAAPRGSTVTQAEVPKASDKPRFLTDEELVASFPKGSCFIAEVDGKKELIFINPGVEHTYVAPPRVRSN